MRSRAAILPYPGDPFLLHYWLELFYRVWSDEIDKLYIICNTPVEKQVAEYIEFLCTEGDDNKIDFTFIDHHIQHGDAIRMGLEKATKDVENKKTQEVPIDLKDAHYKGAQRLGRGEGYKYAHDYADHYVEQEYMPNKVRYYEPTELGFEKQLKERLDKLRKNQPN